MKRIIEIPDKVVEAIQNGEDYRYDIHTAIAQSKPYDDSGDLISRSALKGVIETYRPALITSDLLKGKNNMVDYCISEIDNAQAVDLWQMRQEATENALEKAEVLYARPQGEWKTAVHGLRAYHVCNKCNTEYPFDLTQDWILCPVCGADMRGGAE